MGARLKRSWFSKPLGPKHDIVQCECLPGTIIVGFFSSSQLYEAPTSKSEILFGSKFPTVDVGLAIESPKSVMGSWVSAILIFSR